jgi:hypothetical protein
LKKQRKFSVDYALAKKRCWKTSHKDDKDKIKDKDKDGIRTTRIKNGTRIRTMGREDKGQKTKKDKDGNNKDDKSKEKMKPAQVEFLWSNLFGHRSVMKKVQTNKR